MTILSAEEVDTMLRQARLRSPRAAEAEQAFRASHEALRAALARTEEERDKCRAAILDIDAHATAIAEDASGFVAVGYTITVGSLHRALGLVGHPASKCWDELPCPRAERAEARAEELERTLKHERMRAIEVDEAYHAWQRANEAPTVYSVEGDWLWTTDG